MITYYCSKILFIVRNKIDAPLDFTHKIIQLIIRNVNYRKCTWFAC